MGNAVERKNIVISSTEIVSRYGSFRRRLYINIHIPPLVNIIVLSPTHPTHAREMPQPLAPDDRQSFVQLPKSGG